MVAESQGDLKYKVMAMASGGMDGGSDEQWMNYGWRMVCIAFGGVVMQSENGGSGRRLEPQNI